MQELLKARDSLPEETKELFSRALKLLWKAGNDAVRKNVKMNSKKNIKSWKNEENYVNIIQTVCFGLDSGKGTLNGIYRKIQRFMCGK